MMRRFLTALLVLSLGLSVAGCASGGSVSGRVLSSPDDVKQAASEFPIDCALDDEYDNDTGYYLVFVCAPGPEGLAWDYGFIVGLDGGNGYSQIGAREEECTKYTQDIDYVEYRSDFYDKVPFVVGENWDASIIGASESPPDQLNYENLASTLGGALIEDPYEFCESRFGLVPKDFVGVSND